MGKEGDVVKEKPVMLIVDDVEINRVVLTQFFQDEYTIVEAVNGREAMNVMERQSVAIVLADLIMPVMDGFELLAMLKNDEAYSFVPIVVMTARSDGDSEARAMELGAADFITKPYNPTVVRCRIRNVMARRENEWHVVEQVAMNQQLKEMHRILERDTLTEIDNRETFYRKASVLMQEKQDISYNIVYFDISCFKAINDIFRIETGNLVLKTAAYYFSVITEGKGVCARIEADHFVICMPAAHLDMDNLMAGLDSTIESLGISHSVRFYAGVYPVSNVYLPVDQMCDRAHLALKRIKGNYNQRYAYYDKSMRDLMLDAQMILRDMEFALQERQFQIYFQPIYSLEKKCVVSAEALVRWQHPTRGLISPFRFIPLFERNGFISRLDRFVWEEVCRFLKTNLECGNEVVPISVNVSRLDFYNSDLLIFLLDLIKRYDLKPSMLKLEVTETAYTDNPHQLMAGVREFQLHGFKVLMDDFGSGYSSLNMLKSLPVDILKIDMGFVKEVEQSSRAGVILESIVSMAKQLSMDLIVEGVETTRQVEYLQSIGCDKIQGYYFSRPIPESEFTGLLMRDRIRAKQDVKQEEPSLATVE